MTVDVRLDPRPARQLTSREVAKIVSAMLGYQIGVVCAPLLAEKACKDDVFVMACQAVHVARATVRSGGNFCSMLEAGSGDERVIAMAAPIASVLLDAEIVSRADALTALDWFSDTVNGQQCLEMLAAQVWGLVESRRAEIEKLALSHKAAQRS